MKNQKQFPATGRQSRRHRRLFLILPALLILTVFLLVRPFAAFSDNALFLPTSEVVPLSDDIAARRARPARVNWVALGPDTPNLRLNLFDRLTLAAERVRVDEPATGGFVWVGRITGEPDSRVTLSVQGGVLSGSIYRFGHEWVVIRYAGEVAGDLYSVVEIDPTAPEPNGVDFVVPQPSEDERQAILPDEATCREDGSVIDLLVAYTPAARAAAGGTEAIEALINQRVSEMNTANDDSAVGFDWRLAHVMEVPYPESGNLQTDLMVLQSPADGLMDEIHPAREEHKADLVALLIAEGNHEACGLAFQMEEWGPWFQGYSFGVSALDYPGDYTCSSLTLAHELGHNLGNGHDRANTHLAPLFPFSYGYQSPSGTFRDIMSYDCPGGCPRVGLWSNPDIWYMGEPAGVDYESNPAQAADVARSMNEARTLVANFRPNCEDPVPTNVPPPTETPPVTLAPTTPAATSPPPTTQPSPEPTSAKALQLLYMPAIVRK